MSAFLLLCAVLSLHACSRSQLRVDTDAPADPTGDSDADTNDACLEPDADGDGHEAIRCGGDACDDTDPLVFPGAPDTAGDGIDGDCDGSDGVDADGDGYDSEDSGGDDCDDTDPGIHPGAPDGTWILSTLDAEGNNGLDTSLAVDADGAVHVSYHDSTDEDLRYATNASGEWTIEVVDEEGWTGIHTSLVLDDDDAERVVRG